MNNDRFVGYLSRSAEQITEELKAKFPLFLPEITDIDNDPLFISTNIWAAIVENLHYYLDKKAQETFLATCQKWKSALLIAEANDYRAKGAYPASVDITFYFDNAPLTDVFIPKDTIISTLDGIPYMTAENATIVAGSTEITVGAIQRERFEGVDIGVSTGTPNQILLLPENSGTLGVAPIVDLDIRLQIASNIYGQVETFIYSGKNDFHFVASLNADRQMQVKMGDGITARIPPIGESILADFYVCEGANGNVQAGKIIELSSPITVPSGYILKCTNRQKASGGVNAESLQNLQKRIPLTRHTLLRAVTVQDYIDLAELYPGVERAGVIGSCQAVKLYISPAGGGIASMALINTLTDYFSDKKMIGHKLEVLAAGEIKMKLKIEIKALPNYINTTVANAAKARILAFGSAENQQINGEVQLGDVYEVIENTEGVRYSKVLNLTPIPYAQPLTAKVLAWSVEVLEGSIDTVSWKIIFSSAITFQLVRNNTFFGNYAVGVLVTTSEIAFTVVSAGYITGDAWNFKTYKYNGTIVLEEPSLPIFLESDLEITIKGGI